MLARPLRCALLTACALVGSCATAPRVAAGGPPFTDPSRSTDEQAEAAEQAAQAARSAGVEQVVAWFADPSAQVRDAVFETLVEVRDERLLAGLAGHLGHSNPLVSSAVAELYGQCGYRAGRAALEAAALKSRDESTQLEAIAALARLGETAAAKTLEKIAKSGPKGARFRAAGDALIALAELDPERARPLWEAALRAPERSGSQALAALEAWSRVDPSAAAFGAVEVLAQGPYPKAGPFAAPLERACLDALAGWRARSANPTAARRAVEVLVARSREAEGTLAARLAQALREATGEELPAGGWSDWWAARGASWNPRDLPAPGASGSGPGDPAQGEGKKEKKKGKKKKKKKKSKQDKAKEEDEDDAEEAAEGEQGAGRAEPGRVRTGEGDATRVRFCGVPVDSRRVLFLQDCSGGMSRHPVEEDVSGSPLRIDFSREQLLEVLAALPEQAEVNLMFFATTARVASPRLVSVGRERERLLRYVRAECRTPEGQGQTRSNLYDALELALSDPATDTIFFLSEGGQTEGRYVAGERLLRHLEALNRYRRVAIHCLQVTDKHKRREFLEALSARTGGRYFGLDVLRRAARPR